MVDSFSLNEKLCEETPSERDSSPQSDQESIIDWFLDIINIKKIDKYNFQ